MHSKTKGGIGVSKAISYFLNHEIPCFTETFCDLSQIDLIVENLDGVLKTIQVRTTEERKGCATLSLRSIMPGTKAQPCKTKRLRKDIDIFVLYVKNRDLLLFIDGEEVKCFESAINFRLKEARNNQIKGCRNYKKYLIPSFLRGK